MSIYNSAPVMSLIIILSLFCLLNLFIYSTIVAVSIQFLD